MKVFDPWFFTAVLKPFDSSRLHVAIARNVQIYVVIACDCAIVGPRRSFPEKCSKCLAVKAFDPWFFAAVLKPFDSSRLHVAIARNVQIYVVIVSLRMCNHSVVQLSRKIVHKIMQSFWNLFTSNLCYRGVVIRPFAGVLIVCARCGCAYDQFSVWLLTQRFRLFACIVRCHGIARVWVTRFTSFPCWCNVLVLSRLLRVPWVKFRIFVSICTPFYPKLITHPDSILESMGQQVLGSSHVKGQEVFQIWMRFWIC